MTLSLPLRCECGRVRGFADEVSAKTGCRLVCYCDDCQAYPRHLQRPDVLNANGGTDVFALAPSRVRVTEGLEELRCLRLSDRGMFRFYAGCCRTPVGNMMGPRAPFIGLIHSFLDPGATGNSRDELLGPAVHVMGRFAHGDVPSHVHEKTPFGVVVRAGRLIVGWMITGKSGRSPFFDPNSRTPIAPVEVLDASARAALRRQASTPQP